MTLILSYARDSISSTPKKATIYMMAQNILLP